MQANFTTNAGGVRMFIKSSYLFNKIDSPNLNANACEDIWIGNMLSNKRKYTIGVIYCQPNYSINSFLYKLEFTTDILNRNAVTQYICSDIHINLLKTDNSNVLNHKNTLLCHGCNQYVQNAAHVVNDFLSSLLYHLYSNNESYKILSHTLISDISNHLPIVTTVTNLIPINKPLHNYQQDNKFCC